MIGKVSRRKKKNYDITHIRRRFLTARERLEEIDKSRGPVLAERENTQLTRSRGRAKSRSRMEKHQLTLEAQGRLIVNSLFNSLVNDERTFVDRLTIIQPFITNVVLELDAIAAGGFGLGITAQEAIMEINNNIIRFASDESYGPYQFRRDCEEEVLRISNNNNIITEAMGKVTLSKFTGVATLGTLYMTMFWQQLQGIIQSLLAVRTSALPWMLDTGTAGLVGKIAYKELYEITTPYTLKNTTFPEVQQAIAAVSLLRSHNVKRVAQNMFALADALEEKRRRRAKKDIEDKTDSSWNKRRRQRSISVITSPSTTTFETWAEPIRTNRQKATENK